MVLSLRGAAGEPLVPPPRLLTPLPCFIVVAGLASSKLTQEGRIPRPRTKPVDYH